MYNLIHFLFHVTTRISREFFALLLSSVMSQFEEVWTFCYTHFHFIKGTKASWINVGGNFMSFTITFQRMICCFLYIRRINGWSSDLPNLHIYEIELSFTNHKSTYKSEIRLCDCAAFVTKKFCTSSRKDFQFCNLRSFVFYEKKLKIKNGLVKLIFLLILRIILRI
jgi:hypothetical protein